MPIQIDQDFANQVAELASVSAAAGDAAQLNGQREWMFPPLNGWSGNPLDITGTNDAFDRTDLNTYYSQALTDSTTNGTVADCSVAQIQIDYTAIIERAFRTRHATRIRCTAHATGRRISQGSDNSIFTSGVIPFVQQLIQTGTENEGV